MGRFIDLWQGNLDVLGENCLRNVFIWHNTFVEILRRPGATQKGRAVNLSFPDRGLLSFSGLQNVRIAHNVFAFDSNAAVALHELVHWSISKDYRFERNLWSTLPQSSAVSADNTERPSMPVDMPLLGDSLLHFVVPQWDTAIKSHLNPEFMWRVPYMTAIPPFDYADLPRKSDSINVGAFEYRAVSVSQPVAVGRLRIYPVPAADWIAVDLLPEQEGEPYALEVRDMSGRLVMEAANTNRLFCGHLLPGYYTITLRSRQINLQTKFIKVSPQH